MHRSIADKARFAVGLVGVAVVSAVVWLTMWAAIAPPAFGWSPVAVTSGSMEPRIDTGDIVIVEPFDGGVLAPGTVIVFDSSSSRGKITHRIVEVTASGDYVTRGDANGRIDSTPVSPDEIVGVGRMLVPGVGRPIVWVENGQWSMLVAAGLVLLLAAWASRWALLKRYDPWRGGVHVPPPPSGGRRSRFRLVPVVLIVLVALTAGAVTTQSRATFAAFSGNASSSVIADVLQPPTGVTATGGGDVTLSWTITPDTYASGHRVFRATSPGGPYTQIAQTTPRTTAGYVDSPPDGTYYYVVRAYSTNWESANSNEDGATVTNVALADSWQAGLTHVAGAGADRMLVFVATNEQQTTSTPRLTGVTYGGQPLVPVLADEVSTGCCTALAEIWILDEAGLAAASGTSLVPTWTSAPDTPLYSHAVFENVDQATPIGDTTNASVIGDTPNPVPMASVTTSNGDVVIGAATAGEQGTYTAQNGFTLGVSQATTAGGTTAHGSAHKAATGANETVSMLFNSVSPPWTNRQVALAVVLNVAP